MTWHPCPRITARLRDVVEALRQRPLDRHFKEAGGLGMDNGRAVRGEEGRDLLLSTARDCRVQRDRAVDTEHERMGVLRQSGILGKGQVVAVERGPVGQVPRSENVRVVWVWGALVS